MNTSSKDKQEIESLRIEQKNCYMNETTLQGVTIKMKVKGVTSFTNLCSF